MTVPAISIVPPFAMLSWKEDQIVSVAPKTSLRP